MNEWHPCIHTPTRTMRVLYSFSIKRSLNDWTRYYNYDKTINLDLAKLEAPRKLWMYSTPGLTKQIVYSEAEKLKINLSSQMVIVNSSAWKKLRENCLARITDDNKTVLKFEPRPRNIVDENAFLNYYSEEERNGL